MKRAILVLAVMLLVMAASIGAQAAELERVNGDTAVYYINSGTAYHIPDAATFQALEFNWNSVSNVNSISASRRGWMPSVNDSDVLVKGSGPRIFVMRGGQLHHVVSPSVFEREFGKGGWQRVKTIPDALLNRYPQGQPIS